jgi:hypothetical protein
MATERLQAAEELLSKGYASLKDPDPQGDPCPVSRTGAEIP